MRAVTGVAFLALLGFSALAGAACSKKAGEGATAPATAGAGSGAGGSANTANLPKPKAGKWKMTMTMSTMPQPVVTEVCLDAAALKDMETWNQNHQKKGGMSCSEQSVKFERGAVVSHSVCAMNGATVTTDSRASGDFNSRYTTTIKSKMEPAPGGMGESTNTIVSEYMGAC